MKFESLLRRKRASSQSAALGARMWPYQSLCVYHVCVYGLWWGISIDFARADGDLTYPALLRISTADWPCLLKRMGPTCFCPSAKGRDAQSGIEHKVQQEKSAEQDWTLTLCCAIIVVDECQAGSCLATLLIHVVNILFTAFISEVPRCNKWDLKRVVFVTYAYRGQVAVSCIF